MNYFCRPSGIRIHLLFPSDSRVATPSSPWDVLLFDVIEDFETSTWELTALCSASELYHNLIAGTTGFEPVLRFLSQVNSLLHNRYAKCQF